MAASSSSSSSSALSRLSNIQNHLNPIDSLAKNLVKISPEVSEALSHGHAVVALESTIISHGADYTVFFACVQGMPYPQNFETAKEVEAIVRNNGAVPATIAILEGLPCVGLSTEELERLAKLGSKAQKTARRDIAHVVATRGNGATTVSATMFFASMVGIPVFVTGGIGGVHRHGEHTMDISSDLTELGRTPVAVISAGIKSILDIPRTLEKLMEFVLLLIRRMSFRLFSLKPVAPRCLVVLIAQKIVLDVNMKLKLGSGLVIGVPIPREHAASGRVIESAIQSALREAREKNITGNAETPFLLARVNELTGGLSLASSILSL
ncbi:Indigoidine synthase A family protein [Citrus sinensis]|uniref:Indigoidine synthase A family protein n=2 Tax=Citrus sinensis TaxID=2711 RepID=A0ACB8MXL9_CITSI|nr:Indigoidine synthase A family protein [Citrus sinensis]